MLINFAELQLNQDRCGGSGEWFAVDSNDKKSLFTQELPGALNAFSQRSRGTAMAAQAKTEPVRNEIKHRVDLMRVDPGSALQQMIRIQRVEYCLLERWDKSESQIEPLSEQELWPEIMLNSLHYDTPELWKENLGRVASLLRNAHVHRLRIGTSENEILKTVNQLW